MNNIVAKRKSTGEIIVSCLLQQDVDSTLQSYDPPLDMTDVEILENVSDNDLKTWIGEYNNSTLTYSDKRKAEYPSMPDQLDYIFHHGVEKWKEDMVMPVKNKYPKE